MSVLERIRWMPYRVARRFGAVSLSNLFLVDSSKLADQPLPPELRHAWLTADFVDSSDGDVVDRLRPLADYLGDEATVCGGVFDADNLVAFAWSKTGTVPGELNSDGDDHTRLPIYLPSDTAYVFNVYVAPEQRGNRLYAALVTQIARKLSQRGVSKILLTTESSNPAALKSVRRMGFERIGGTRLLRFGNWSWASYPPTAMPSGIRIGTYSGDTRSTQSTQAAH